MRLVAILTLAVIGLFAACSSSVPAPEDARQLPAGADPPGFGEYPAAADAYAGAPVAPDFATLPGARVFGTAIRNGVAQGPNFAGRHIVVTWGCGTECEQFVIVDAATGAITDGFTTRWGVRHRLDSDLLIVNPRPEDLPAHIARRQRTSYYRWTGTGLELIAME